MLKTKSVNTPPVRVMTPERSAVLHAIVSQHAKKANAKICCCGGNIGKEVVK
jgi:hypothetical protein